MAGILRQNNQTNSAVIKVAAAEGGEEVSAAQVIFSLYPDSSASLTVQVLDAAASAANFEDIALQVSLFAQEMFRAARGGGIPIWTPDP